MRSRAASVPGHMASKHRHDDGGLGRLYAALWTHAAGRRAAYVAALTMLVLAQVVRICIPWLFGLAVFVTLAADRAKGFDLDQPPLMRLTLVRADLMAAVDAIRLSRRTLRVIKGNLFWAFAYNVAALPLAASGLLSPMIAGAAMAFSSVFVVAGSLRLRRFTASDGARAATGG